MYGPSPKTHENYTTTVKWSTSAIGRFWPTSRGSKNGHGLHQFVRSQVAKDDLTYWVHRSVPWFCGFRAWAATSAAWGRRNITASLVLDDNLSLTRGYSRDIYIIIIISIIIIIYIYIHRHTITTWYRMDLVQDREGRTDAGCEPEDLDSFSMNSGWLAAWFEDFLGFQLIPWDIWGLLLIWCPFDLAYLLRIVFSFFGSWFANGWRWSDGPILESFERNLLVLSREWGNDPQ